MFSINSIGVKILTKKSIIGATNKEILSEFCNAKFFGVISPNISITKVVKPTDIPSPAFENLLVVIMVAIDDVATLTMLLPISIAPINLLLSS